MAPMELQIWQKIFVTQSSTKMEGIEIGKQPRLVCFQSLFQSVNSVSLRPLDHGAWARNVSNLSFLYNYRHKQSRKIFEKSWPHVGLNLGPQISSQLC